MMRRVFVPLLASLVFPACRDDSEFQPVDTLTPGGQLGDVSEELRFVPDSLRLTYTPPPSLAMDSTMPPLAGRRAPADSSRAAQRADSARAATPRGAPR